MALPHERVCPWNHLHHTTRTGRANRITVSFEFVQRVERVDFFKESNAIFVAKTIVIDVLDDAKALCNFNQVRSDENAPVAKAPGGQINHRVNVGLTGLRKIR